ncbi:hypothetical protein IJH23_00055 [Candidatus Saccharibacteria bacterium]|nr:hypothetical protein [Candidatus Saccharibacteria bacterium]MBQ3470101.1 hypothetical protein [Candidatus Saccharibacteria bacterium]
MSYHKKVLFGLVGFVAVAMGLLVSGGTVSAFSVTPMKQTISLAEGDSYTGRVTAFVNEQQGGTFYYEASIKPLTVNDNNNEYAAATNIKGDHNDIVNWVTLSNGEETADANGVVRGSLELGESVDFSYTIDVPRDARGGGQYFAVVITSVPNPNEDDNGGNLAIRDNISIISSVFAEVAGDINVSGIISDNNVPSFLTNPPITTSFLAKNEGNTHSEVTYYLQVWPLFSDEEIYTTEEKPGTDHVLPDTTRYVKQTWDKTPAVGIFRVRQTVYYDSTDSEPSVTEKLVIVCPVWLLFLILFVIIAIIIWIVMRVRSRGKNKRTRDAAAA